ncbi:MAG: BLUF domain-containing protein, partial [Luteibacter sp.]
MNKAPPDLRRIFYISRAARALTDAEIQNILRISQRNNRRNDITGCLLCSGEYFAQTLEGRRDALDGTLARIAADPRHAEVHVVFDENVDSRICPEWSMG